MFENYKKLVEKEIRKIFVGLKDRDDIPNILYDAMWYSIFNGGKRIRPILCLGTYDAIKNQKLKVKNQSYYEILPFACGLEFIHTFSLIQDDLPSMDNDDFRRGKPSLHKAFNEGVAILAADALFALAFELFAKAKTDNKKKIKAINELAYICGVNGLVSGQMLDILSRNTKLKNKKSIDEKKTAVLIAGAMKIGAIVADAPVRIIKQIERAGVNIGLLFQLTDDILDSKIIQYQVRVKTLSYAQKVKSIFKNLGDNFTDFIKFTNYLLQRKV